MSNFGRLGSAMVNDAATAGSAYRSMDTYNNNADARELKQTKDSQNLANYNADIEMQGGQEQAAIAAAKLAKETRANNASMVQLKLENQRARNAKVSADAMRSAMKKGAAGTKAGSMSVVVKPHQVQ